MKRTCLLACAVALVTLCSCTVKEQRLGYDDATGGVVLTALTDMPGVRTGVVDGGTEVFWESQEEIKVFAGTSSAKFVSANTDLASKADFIGPSDFSVAPGKPVVAVYPYSDDVAYDGECITMTLPSEQVACPGTFARGTNIAVAKSDTHTLQFRNVCGGLRFSVKEEGITKVIFEGLGGEMIAGKVKIGFEDGIPVVREVTDGRIFITLTAPDGGTFEVGKWYYIVAIPGALEKGYKLRFYKDDTYARLTSENAVQVKRSVFGSVADADEGVEYESIVAEYPTNETEWDEAMDIADAVTAKTQTIIESHKDYDIKDLAKEFENIDNVASAFPNEDNTAIIVKLIDGVHINMLLHTRSGASENGEIKTKGIKLNSLETGGYNTPSGKTALILAPFHFAFNEDLDSYYDCLTSMGYQVDSLINKNADYSQFEGENLSKYDVIYISTHGTARAMTVDGSQADRSALTTGTLFSERFEGRHQMLLDRDLVILGAEGKTYYGATDRMIDGGKFTGAYIYLSVCYSSAFAYKFYEQAAAVAIGFAESVGVSLCCDFENRLFSLLSQGYSDQDAIDSIMNYYSVNSAMPSVNYDPRCAEWRNFMLNYQKRYASSKDRFYLFDPAPYNLKSSVGDKDVALTWSMPPSNAEYEIRLIVDNQEITSGYTKTGKNNYKYIYSPGEKTDHHWYVSVEYKATDEFFESEVDYFKTAAPHTETFEAVDLGLPSGLKWASFNLGASTPEEYGDLYAWGENETKSYFDFSNYKWGAWTTLSKYCVDPSNGNVDNKTVLEPEDDVASVKLGADWRIPTVEEWEELKANCSCQWCQMNGVAGAKLTSLKNGNYIFFPAGGWQYESVWADTGKTIRYWTSSLRAEEPTCAWGYWAAGNFLNKEYSSRCYGRSIRPVSSRQSTGKSELVITPESLNFGEVAVGSSRGNEAGRVTMTNTGSSNLVISSFDCPAGFSHSPNLALPHTIAPGDSWTVTFAFKPTSAKQYSGYIKINSNASNGSVKQVKVSGTGI